MKKNRDHLPFLDEELTRLCAVKFSISPETMLLILAGRGPAKKEADSVCEHYCKTLEWLEMSDEARADVVCRLRCMQWYCCDVLPDAVDTGMSGQEVLSSYLCEYWDDGGRVDWLLEEMLGIDSKRTNFLFLD